jgi:hypothetical protein
MAISHVIFTFRVTRLLYLAVDLQWRLDVADICGLFAASARING